MKRFKLYYFILHILLAICYVKCLQVEQICGGDETCKGYFQYMVSIQVNGKGFCGGGILSDYFVISAAHCFLDKDKKFIRDPYRIYAGKIDLSAKKVGYDVAVKRIYVHKDYVPVREIDDIAVLHLDHSLNLEYNRDLTALRLPPKNAKYDLYFGISAVIAGYGWDWVDIKLDEKSGKPREVGGIGNPKLKYAFVDVISNKECKEKNPYTQVMDTIICAQMIQQSPNIRKGVCSGDSGGPLVINDVVIGLLSTSPFGCDETKHAAVYTRVDRYIPFITKIMEGAPNIEDTVSYEVPISVVNKVWSKLKGIISTKIPTSTAEDSKIYYDGGNVVITPVKL